MYATRTVHKLEFAFTHYTFGIIRWNTTSLSHIFASWVLTWSGVGSEIQLLEKEWRKNFKVSKNSSELSTRQVKFKIPSRHERDRAFASRSVRQSNWIKSMWIILHNTSSFFISYRKSCSQREKKLPQFTKLQAIEEKRTFSSLPMKSLSDLKLSRASHWRSLTYAASIFFLLHLKIVRDALLNEFFKYEEKFQFRNRFEKFYFQLHFFLTFAFAFLRSHFARKIYSGEGGKIKIF
jgi:hypothetical protein